MTSLNLGDAASALQIPSEPFTQLTYGPYTFGDWGGSPLPNPHPVRIVDGIPGIPRRNGLAGVTNLDVNTAISTPLIGATFVAFRGEFDSDYSYANPGVEMCYYTSSICTDKLWGAYVHDQAVIDDEFPLAVAHTPDGLSVYAFVNNSSEAFVANSLQGVLAAIPPITQNPGTTNGSINTAYVTTELDIVGMWHFAGEVSQTDAVDTMDTILTYLQGSPNKAVGGHGVGGTAHATPMDDLISAPPVTHARPPGGTQEPPPLPPIVVPDNVPDPRLGLVWETFDQPVELNHLGMPVDWAPIASGREDYGRLQIVIEGQDVTWVDGVPTPLPHWRRVQPFGSYGAEITFPSISVFGTKPSWMKHGANVSFRILKTGGGETLTFTGVIGKIGRNEDAGSVMLTCHGAMFVSDLQVRPQRFFDAPVDIGQEIATVLNGAVNRRHNTVTPVVTGERTSVTGSGEPLLTGYVQRVLSTAIIGGRQLTVDCPERTPIIRKKDLTTIAWEVQAGQRGIDIDLEDDAAESPNRYFADGVNLDGGAWRGMLFPNWKPDDTPPFPNSNASNSFTRGARDSDTDSGNGISLLEERLGLPVDGYLSTSDWKAIIRFQRKSGIPDDGWVGGQTWATAFKTGENTGTLDGAWRAPLAFAPEVMPFLFGPDGAILGPNPEHDPGVIVVDRDLSLGAGVSKQTGIDHCEKLLERDSGAGWAGSIKFSVDLPDRHRFELREGENGLIRDWDGPGNDIVVHVASVDVNPAGGRTGETILDVDTRARDYPELASILERRRNSSDPARAMYRKMTSATLGNARPTFDAESPAGHLPRHAVFGGFWDIRPMPLGDRGTINRTEMRTTGPATTFCVGIFAKPITPNALSAIIGNPLNATEESPWQVHNDELRERGLIMSWGMGAQPLGYDPRQFHTPAGETGAPVTGRFLDDSAWEYYSLRVPWVWVATITSAPCYLEGRFRGMPADW